MSVCECTTLSDVDPARPLMGTFRNDFWKIRLVFHVPACKTVRADHRLQNQFSPVSACDLSSDRGVACATVYCQGQAADRQNLAQVLSTPVVQPVFSFSNLLCLSVERVASQIKHAQTL